MLRILAVDDDPAALRSLATVLGNQYEVIACGSGSEAIRVLVHQHCDLVLADLSMPPPDGFEVLRAAQSLSSPPPVIVITAMDTARATMEALRLGARDYLVKPAAPDQILAAVGCVAAEAGATRAEPEKNFGLVGRSVGMQSVRRLIPLLSRSEEIVLIQGETGCGKELLARALHEYGPRSSGPLVTHNMAATPSELAESIFFGHVRGAFSGASTDHPGLFEQADGGTLFMDEVDSFPLAMQAKLLRVLETARVQRVGSTTERAFDVRVLAASAVDLGEMVERNAFRADLYYRLRQIEVVIPPLRERMEDIPMLAQHFLQESTGETGRRRVISTSAMRLLQTYSWPGNCRELRNAIRSAGLLAGDGPILPGHLPRAVCRSDRVDAHPPSSATLLSVEREHILQTLQRTGGKRGRAAQLLGIDRGTLARKLKALGIPVEGEPG